MSTATKNVLYALFFLLTGTAIGYFVGGKIHSQYDTEVEYRRAPEYKVNFKINTPKVELLTGDFTFSDTIIPDTFNFPDSTTEDDLKQTAYDWNLERKYIETLFDNQYGKFSFEATVKNNRLQSITPSFSPIEKVITRTIVKKWQPFASVSYSSLGHVSAGGGMFYRNVGVSVNYVTDFSRKGFDVGLMYKF